MDADAFADAMRKDVSTCCSVKAKSVTGKRRRIVDSSDTSEEDKNSDDDVWTRRKKPKTKPNENVKSYDRAAKGADDAASTKPPASAEVSHICTIYSLPCE